MKAVVRNKFDLLKFVDSLTAKLGDNLGDKPITIIAQPFKRLRTLPQNARFHAMCAERAEHCGYTPTEIKDYIKAEHGFRKTIEIGGVIKDIPMGTSEMNVEQLSFLIEELYRIGSEVGCVYQEVDDDKV